MPRKKYTADLKAKAVLEVLKECKTVSEIAAQYAIHLATGVAGEPREPQSSQVTRKNERKGPEGGSERPQRI